MGWRSGQSYSRDLRDRVLRAVDGGLLVRQAAPVFGVSIAYIYKAMIRRRVTSDAGINPNRGHAPRKLSGAQEIALGAHNCSRPGITLAQAHTWLRTQHDVELSTGAIWNAARRRGLSFQKKLWRAVQPFLDPESLVFLDETGVNTKMARLYGWAPIGERCRDKAPFGHWKTMKFVAGPRLSGMTAPWVLDRHGWRCLPHVRPACPCTDPQDWRRSRPRQPART